MKKWMLLGLLAAPSLAHADEGMWTYDNVPADAIAKKYAFKPDAAWLEKARLSSVRLAEGCSASFVSANGLVMTNHHCAHECIEQLSTKEKDFVQSGFTAKTEADEVKCPTMEANQLIEIKDVTDEVKKATAGLTDQKYAEAQKALFSKLEKACAGDDAKLRCDVVDLYHGGRYHLYKYRRFQDVRLAFAPEFGIAFFGGDPDNFMFPRWDLDVAFVRVWEDGKPAATPNHFGWSAAGAKEGQLTFVSGHPGSTSRLDTVAELKWERDGVLPFRLMMASELRGMLTEFAERGPEQKRTSNATLFYVENGIKARKGRLSALLDEKAFAAKVKAENDLRAKLAADPEKQKKFGGAWDAIATSIEKYKAIRAMHFFVEGGRGFMSELFGHARTLVRAADELAKPNEKRLREFADSNLPAIKQGLGSTAPIHAELEIEQMTWSLTKLREELGPDDAFVKKLLGKKSPRDVATEAIKGTKLADKAEREALFAGGKKAIDASKDPMVLLAKLVDPDARAVRKTYEEQIEAVESKAGELIAQAQFETYGTSTYPDATFTLRLSYGAVRGWKRQDGKQIAPITTIKTAYDRHTGAEPFALPKSWLDAKSKLKLETPLNLCTDNDIIGGNSGSPMFDKDLNVVGLIFDGNIDSLGGDFFFDDSVNRAVAVHSAALVETLDKVYGAKRLVDELVPPKAAPAKK